MPRKKMSADGEPYSSVRKYDSAFSRNLSALVREKKDKIGKARLCEELGVTKRTIELWEGQNARPDIDRLASLADYFGVTVDYLVGRSEHKTPTLEDAAICEKYGLNEQTLLQLEQLAAPLNTDKEMARSIIEKILRPESDFPTFAVADDATVIAESRLSSELTKEELEYLFYTTQYEINKQTLSALNELLTTPTGRELETYGMLILHSIYEYCHREYADVTQEHMYIGGRVRDTLTPEMQRNLELYKINEALSRLREKLESKKEMSSDGQH